MKVPEKLLRELDAAAAGEGVGKSAFIRDCLERALRKPGSKPASCLQLMGESVGSVKGPRDLSTNRRYLKQAITRHERTKRSGAR